MSVRSAACSNRPDATRRCSGILTPLPRRRRALDRLFAWHLPGRDIGQNGAGVSADER